jgi:hypothetical protein
MKAKAAVIKFLVQLHDAVLKIATRNLDIKVAQPKIQQPLVRPRRPIGEIVPSGIGGHIWCRLALVLHGHRSDHQRVSPKAGTLYVLTDSSVDPHR